MHKSGRNLKNLQNFELRVLDSCRSQKNAENLYLNRTAPDDAHGLLDVPREDLTPAALGLHDGKEGGDGPAHDSLAA